MSTAKTTNLSIRIDASLKKEADALFAELGMNLTTAFNIFVRQSIRMQKIPFDISLIIPNAETLEAMRESKAIANDPNVKGYRDIKELLKALNS